MLKKTLNFRVALEQMLEYIRRHRVTVGEASFVLSDSVLLQNPLIRETLEKAGCLQPLSRLDSRISMFEGRYGRNFRKTLIGVAQAKGIAYPWNRKVWEILESRSDRVNVQLLLDRPSLEQVEKLYGSQVQLVGEDGTKLDDEPWRFVPE